ncbi:hypothetical protein CERSUDRAFT_91924 [Gelatoporia subvermispora B]|uniref:Uncharacterized protein n=1 Tax=Ceriporiopsis subvermispora (strain B) TaxID=914234 RepID=M2QVM4_CERS8|nr:hypothetical protein CERSUDRAFT_91924 [Gelatoporia subvermispora B]
MSVFVPLCRATVPCDARLIGAASEYSERSSARRWRLVASRAALGSAPARNTPVRKARSSAGRASRAQSVPANGARRAENRGRTYTLATETALETGPRARSAPQRHAWLVHSPPQIATVEPADVHDRPAGTDAGAEAPAPPCTAPVLPSWAGAHSAAKREPRSVDSEISSPPANKALPYLRTPRDTLERANLARLVRGAANDAARAADLSI